MPNVEIQTDLLRFKPSLPFSPREEQVIYVEGCYNANVNEFLRNNYGGICTAFDNIGYEFCYFPNLSRKLVTKEFVHYFTPYQEGTVCQLLDSTCLIPFLQNGNEIGAAFLVYDNEASDSRGYAFRTLRLDGHEQELRPLFEAFVYYLNEWRREDTGARFCCTTDLVCPSDVDDYADERFPEEVMNLMEDVHDKVNRLRQCGVSEMVLRSLLNPQLKLSYLQITAKGRILLPGYGNMEIKMSPLVKSVYLLFLRHPEGIVFKLLPDYRGELHEIYTHLTGRSSNEAVMQSIKDVTDPCKNSINEKCARIREAFVREFDDRLAEYYYVTGNRGEAKRVRLPERLVVWEWDVKE